MTTTYGAYLEGVRMGETATTGANLFLDVRDGALIDELQQQLDYYRGYQMLGMYLQAEWSHLDPNTFAVVSNGNSNTMASHIIAAVDQNSRTSADLVAEQQLVPPPYTDNLLLADVKNGVQIFRPIQAPVKTSEVDAIVKSFNYGPFSAGDWQLITTAEAVRLADMAYNAGNGDVNRGLVNLGIIGSYTTVTILVMTADDTNSGTNVHGLYNFTKRKLSGTHPTNKYNYILARRLPESNAQGSVAESADVLLAACQPQSYLLDLVGAVLQGTGLYSVYQNSGSYTWNGAQYNKVNSSTTFTQRLPVTSRVYWSSSNANSVTVSNADAIDGYSQGHGQVTTHQSPATATLTANLCTALNGTAGAPGVTRSLQSKTYSYTSAASAPVLTSILVSPYQKNYPTVTPVNCYATGFYSDNTVKDLTGQVTWGVTSTSGLASFAGFPANQLNLTAGEHQDTLTITATYNGPDAPTPVSATGAVTTSFP